MSSTTDGSDPVIHANPSAEPRQYCPGKVPGTKAAVNKEISPPQAKNPPAPRRNGWIATLAGLAKPPRQRRQCPQHPGRLHAYYLAGARMSREMGRL